jgi:CRP/FNR family transcriptional regulator, nitrogen oxide reductase regulator
MPQTDTSLVKDFPIFQNIEEADLRAVLQAAKTRRIPKKETVFAQGQRASEFFVLLHGHLKVVQATADGQQIIVRIVQPGEIYGVAMALGRTDYPGTAVAIEESITLVWPSSAWPRLVARAPALAVNALQTVGQRLQEAHARIREFSTEEVERRVAHLLLRIVKASGQAPAETADVEFPITRQDVAEMTGTTLFTVSRILSSWEQDGIVTGGRGRISVKEPVRLRAIAERVPS